MATTMTFSTMLKRYMPTDLLVEEMADRNYLFKSIKKDQSWKGGRYEVPFEGGQASSVALGGLTDSADIAETNAVLGYEDQYREIWGSMIFNGKDLDLIDLEGSFLKLLPNKLNQFMNYMENRFSHVILNGSRIDALTANGDTGGTGFATVTFPERFSIGQKCIIRNSDPVAKAVYVIAVNMNTKVLTLSDTRGGSAYSISAYTTAKSSGLYIDGSVKVADGTFQNEFNSLRGALLSLANGGSSTIHNQTKTAYPFLQSLNISGSLMTSDSALEDIFSAFFEVTRIGKGKPSEILVSFKIFAAISKTLEVNRRFSVGEQKSGYGFVSVDVRGPQGSMTITALRDMDNDVVFIIDWNALKLAGSHFFEKNKDPDGNEYTKVRAATGFTYIVDIKLYGNLIVQNPSYCGVIHSISF